jgi:hypothetical protein
MASVFDEKVYFSSTKTKNLHKPSQNPSPEVEELPK